MRSKSLFLASLAAIVTFSATPFQVSAAAPAPVEVIVGGSAGQRLVDSAMSADGEIIYAVQNSSANFNDHLWRSTDGGVTFTELTNAGVGRWLSVDTSADGQSVYAVWLEYSGTYYLAQSLDGGANWSNILFSMGQMCDVAVSDSGNEIVVARCDSSFYFAENGGTTWSMNDFPAPGSMNRVDISGDGTKVIGISATSVYIANNPTVAATTWTTTSLSSTAIATSVHISQDGSRVLIGTQSGSDADAWVSTDGGTTFTPSGLSGFYGSSVQAVVTGMSGDGMTIVWTFYGGALWISRDGGATFAEPYLVFGWLSAALNSDGTHGVFTIENNLVRLLRREPPTISNVTPGSGIETSVNELTVRGTNFYDGCIAYFNGVAQETDFVSTTKLKVILSSLETEGSVSLVCDDQSNEWSWSYEVLPATTTTATTTPTESTLPPTGSSDSNSVWFAGILISAGLVVMLKVRRIAHSR